LENPVRTGESGAWLRNDSIFGENFRNEDVSMTVNEILDMLRGIVYTTGVFNFQFKLIVMWGVGSLFMYLAIAKKY
jgi:hypothetical protein